MGHTDDLMYQQKAEKQAALFHHIAVAAACLNDIPDVLMSYTHSIHRSSRIHTGAKGGSSELLM